MQRNWRNSMEANQKKRFVCKFCNKRYPCGKSLGGHIRIHLNGSSTDVTEETNFNNTNDNFINYQNQSLGSHNGSSSKRDLSGPSEDLVGGQSGYGLRENPKKTKRFVVDLSNTNMLLDKVCKECGKGFQSLKAVCGHMASHSRNNNNYSNLEEHHYVTSEKLKELVMDGQSDTETSAPGKRRRSERFRYKARCVYSNSGDGSFSSGSDVEQEQEEVAKSLMMLSKDSSFKGCFGSIGDSSDNNSVVLETKSLSVKVRRAHVKNGGADHDFGLREMKAIKQTEEMMSIDNENDESENSDSGYFKNGPKKAGLDVSAKGPAGNDALQKLNVEIESSYCNDFDPELRKRLSRFRRVKAKSRNSLAARDGYKQADISLKNGSGNPGRISSNWQKIGSKTSALGDHKTSQKRTDVHGTFHVENGVDTNNVPRPVSGSSKKVDSCSRKNTIQQKLTGKPEKKLGARKGKIHECPFCSKVFRSGQALGGHKRSHFVGSAGDRTLVIKEDVPEMPMPTLIDLNLPAPAEEETNGFAPW